MRKMLNKKGFSLVELMIVVVIMGILIAVAIPLYGAITDNAKNKTCQTNVDNIRANARNYYLSYNVVATDADVAAMMEDRVMPQCPWDADENTEGGDYTVTYNADGTVSVVCNAAASNEDHVAVS